MRTILAQQIASTHVDRNGERLSKVFLYEYAAAMAGSRHPLHDQHDMSRPTVGYVENHRVEPDPESPSDWVLLADVHLNADVALEVYGGFSISGVEMIREPVAADARLLLAYPHYKNAELLEVLSSDERLALGKWIKKAAGDFEWGVLFGSVLTFVVTPIWDDIYKRKIAPRVDELLQLYLRKIQPQGIGAELVQPLEFRGRPVEVRFIPERRMEAICLRSDSVLAGLRLVVDFLKSDRKSNDVGVRRIVVFYDSAKSGYSLHRIEYADGSVEHAA